MTLGLHASAQLMRLHARGTCVIYLQAYRTSIMVRCTNTSCGKTDNYASVVYRVEKAKSEIFNIYVISMRSTLKGDLSNENHLTICLGNKIASRNNSWEG